MTIKKAYDSQRQRERQARILECARAMLNESGYSGFSMRKLADRACVSRSTLYNLYGSRDTLAVAAVQKSQQEIAERVADLNPDEGVDRLLTASRIGGEQMAAYPHYTQAMARALLNAEPDDQLVEVLFGPHRPPATRQIEIAQEKGQIADHVDPTLFAQHLNGQAWGVTLNWLMGRFTDQQLVTEQLRSLIVALLAIAKGPTKQKLRKRLRELGDDEVVSAKAYQAERSRSIG